MLDFLIEHIGDIGIWTLVLMSWKLDLRIRKLEASMAMMDEIILKGFLRKVNHAYEDHS